MTRFAPASIVCRRACLLLSLVCLSGAALHSRADGPAADEPAADAGRIDPEAVKNLEAAYPAAAAGKTRHVILLPHQERGVEDDFKVEIIAGRTIIDGLLKRFRVNTLVVHTRGVRDGLVREMLEDVLGANEAPVDHAALRDAAIERLASACSGEVEHGRAVASLAGRIWEQLAEPLSLDPADRPLLECAARLQDVGYVINYDKHHKHSYHLIRNSRLPGIRAHDLELIANVARYHRGAHPKKKHENLLRLTPSDQRRVLGMAAVLRLAGGLDRSRSQQVRDAIVHVDGASVTLEAVADQDPQVDLWGAERRTDLFEKVFDMPVKFRWAGSGQP
jgi:exopolyphosphatase/guanosine-5'-triphosphate,3'-diphosphate pyrophosphatase